MKNKDILLKVFNNNLYNRRMLFRITNIVAILFTILLISISILSYTSEDNGSIFIKWLKLKANYELIQIVPESFLAIYWVFAFIASHYYQKMEFVINDEHFAEVIKIEKSLWYRVSYLLLNLSLIISISLFLSYSFFVSNDGIMGAKEFFIGKPHQDAIFIIMYFFIFAVIGLLLLLFIWSIIILRRTILTYSKNSDFIGIYSLIKSEINLKSIYSLQIYREIKKRVKYSDKIINAIIEEYITFKLKEFKDNNRFKFLGIVNFESMKTTEWDHKCEFTIDFWKLLENDGNIPMEVKFLDKYDDEEQREKAIKIIKAYQLILVEEIKKGIESIGLIKIGQLILSNDQREISYRPSSYTEGVFE